MCPRIRGAERRPGIARGEPLGRRHVASRGKESGKARRRQVPEIFVVRNGGDARRAVERQPLENLQDLQLIVQVVLEPQHDLVDRANGAERRQPEGLGQCVIALPETSARSPRTIPSRSWREIRRAARATRPD